MEYTQTIGSAELSGILTLPASLLNRRVKVTVRPVDENEPEKRSRKCQLGFLDLPPLPDSFFDPLPEEDLKAWGL